MSGFACFKKSSRGLVGDLWGTCGASRVVVGTCGASYFSRKCFAVFDFRKISTTICTDFLLMLRPRQEGTSAVLPQRHRIANQPSDLQGLSMYLGPSALLGEPSQKGLSHLGSAGAALSPHLGRGRWHAALAAPPKSSKCSLASDHVRAIHIYIYTERDTHTHTNSWAACT